MRLLIVIVFIAVVAVFFLIRNRGVDTVSDGAGKSSPTDDSGCCGAHEVCEKDSLLSSQIKAEYFDDEELDKFCGVSNSNYSESDIEEFCNVFYTMKESDVAGWLKSLQIRNIELPDSLRDEALMIVQERREKRIQK